MKTCIISFVFLLFFSSIHTQEYFNEAIPFTDGIPNTEKLIITNKNYIVPIINYYQDTPVSSLLIIDKDFGDISISRNNGFGFARRDPTLINNTFYSLSNNSNSNSSNKFSFFKFDINLNILTKKDYSTSLPYGGVSTSSFIDNNMYGLIVEDSGSHRELGIRKLDSMGNLLWSRLYNKNESKSFGWSIIPSQDSNLLVANAVFYNGIPRRRHQILKLDPEGNILWQIDGTEGFDLGATPVWITQLSNSNIVVAYEIFLPIPLKTYHPKVLQWYNKNGDSINHMLIQVKNLSGDKEAIYFNGIKKGKGDFFFTYGYYQNWGSEIGDHTYGMIQKFSNQGDTIWTHFYHQPDNIDMAHSINDIIELDNGDIVAMGDISKPGRITRIWLLKINAEGCLGDDACEDLVITGTSDIIPSPVIEPVILHPNPSTGLFYFDEELIPRIQQIIVTDIAGTIIKTIKSIRSDQIDLSEFGFGLYHVQMLMKDGTSKSAKVVKVE